MQKNVIQIISVLVIALLVISSCKKENKIATPKQNSRKVKYEMSGNYSGKVLVVTSTNSGKMQQFDGVSMPWTKELDYDNTVSGAGMGLQTSGSDVGVAGQTITLKVFLNGVLKDTKTITADNMGLVNSSLAFYTF